ncbi:MAG TPA: nuclear transport factor 2 family protein [Sphingobium sp.]
MAGTDTGTDTGNMVERIRILEARAAIADLVHRYALNIRNRLPEACGALFTDDGVFEIRDADPAGEPGFTTRAHSIGREAVMGYVLGSTRSGFHVFPMIRCSSPSTALPRPRPA